MAYRPRSRRSGRPKKGISGIWLLLGGIFLVGLIIFIALVVMVVKYVPRGHDAKARLECMHNLQMLGNHIITMYSFGGMEKLRGSAFLLQVAENCDDASLRLLVCSGDPRYPSFGAGTPAFAEKYRSNWRTAPCSYRGPDAVRYSEAFLQPGKKPVIIACDRNGPDGQTPHHPAGVVVLLSNGEVEFIKWEQMVGYVGGPVRVGPDSPDPRFRRLIE